MRRTFTALLLCLSLAGCNNIQTNEPSKTPIDESPTVVNEVKNEITESQPLIETSEYNADMLPVSRALAAKMIALALNDRNTIDALDIEIEFSDINKDEWYVKYVNAVVLQDIMRGSGDIFSPLEPLTVEQAQILLDKINPRNTLKIKITDDNRDKPISYALWQEIFTKVLKSTTDDNTYESQFGITEKSIIILATPANNSELKAWSMVTDRGTFDFTGLNMDAYMDKQIKVLEKDGEIIAFLEIESDNPTITNSYITKATDNSISFFVGGVERTFPCDKIPDDILNSIQGKIADIEIGDGKAKKIVLLTDIISGTIKRTNSDYIELMEYGDLALFEDMKIYSIENGNVQWKILRDLIVGSDIAKFVLKDNKICAAIIEKKADAQKVRISINNTDFSNLLHQKVTLTCTTNYTVTYGKEKKNYSKDQVLNLSLDEKNDFGDNRIYIEPSDNGRVELQSITRNNTPPRYRGVFEIKKLDGGYSIVNELGIEEYLYAVVPSEMPTSYGLEAAKVQAVTARSYAFNQIFANRYHKYGANVDDSVQCQVYNNIPENQISIDAVNSTQGECLKYNNVIISANFFSTSSGMTANSGEVWASGERRQFPSDSPEYITAQKQYKNNDFGDLSVEENAAKFFKTTEIESYDSSFSWFRWNVTMSAIEIAASINRNIKEQYTLSPKLIKTLQDNDIYRSRPIESIGNLIDISITKRGEGGNIMEMKITGSDATILVSTEYVVRTLIRPVRYIEGSNDILLTRKDGSKLLNYSLMPSAFYVFEKKYDDNNNLTSVTFYGGGNGHGVGMSQNGVFGMTNSGYKYIDILKHYYKGVDIAKI